MRRLLPVLVLAGVWLVVAADLPPLVYAQTAASRVLVIEGGTLIDGTGGPPIRDAQIVIEGDRVRGLGRKGQPPPTRAQVVNADGKFIVPGLWDGLAHFLWYQGEIFPNNGVPGSSLGTDTPASPSDDIA